jgi:hypothetical protein
MFRPYIVAFFREVIFEWYITTTVYRNLQTQQHHFRLDRVALHTAHQQDGVTLHTAHQQDGVTLHTAHQHTIQHK